ncbi:MAG: type II toxin-antitoxin system RelE/ParE family toxin [Nitrospirae bacterium]|nr:type II toxin-antitoxin system RelE/ParE family toxin [Nitrospirota bacterium]MDA8215012.1 type II toxin-antitoxin system RelE/ParE family toxin [Nitrospiraceae bacterium]
MSYIVKLKRSAEKELEWLPEKIHDRIVASLIALKENPFPVGAKKLHGREGYRIRVGDYRILYVIYESKKVVEVFSIAHRREVYRL